MSPKLAIDATLLDASVCVSSFDAVTADGRVRRKRQTERFKYVLLEHIDAFFSCADDPGVAAGGKPSLL